MRWVRWLPAFTLVLITIFGLLVTIVVAQRQELNLLEQAQVQAVPLNPPVARVHLESIRILGCCVLEVHLPGPPKLWTSVGPSMEPVVADRGIWITTEIAPDEIRVGDILVYKLGGTNRIVGHRVVEVGHDSNGVWYAETQGVNPQTNFERDLIRVRKEHIIGVRIGGF